VPLSKLITLKPVFALMSGRSAARKAWHASQRGFAELHDKEALPRDRTAAPYC
jgi:hypothetical protein